jgi:hypothetical protein
MKTRRTPARFQIARGGTDFGDVGWCAAWSGVSNSIGSAPIDLTTEFLRGASFRFCGLFFSILRCCVRFERTEKTSRDSA